MAIYKLTYCNQKALEVFVPKGEASSGNLKATRIQINRDDPNEPIVLLNYTRGAQSRNTTGNPDNTEQIPANCVQQDGGNISFCIPDRAFENAAKTTYRAVMSQWRDDPEDERSEVALLLYGEIFEGDPDGTGGFGGQDDPE